MIKFLTDGVLLREMMDDPLLTKYRYFENSKFCLLSILYYNKCLSTSNSTNDLSNFKYEP